MIRALVESDMKKTWIAVTLLPCLALGAAGACMAGTLDPLKKLGLDPKAMLQPQKSAVEFHFSNFRLQADSGQATRRWTVDVRINESIEHGYLVRPTVQNRAGEVILSGEDIELPPGAAGKVYHLTRPLQQNASAATLVLQVFSRTENRVVASQTYPLSAVAGYGIQGATLVAQPAGPQASPERNAGLSADIAYSLSFSPGQDEFRIQNDSAYRLRINAMQARAAFQVGVDEEIPVACVPMDIQPGASTVCSYTNNASTCATLSGIALTFKLNGNSYEEHLKFDTPLIRRIDRDPVIRLEKAKSTSSRFDMKGSGIAQVTVRGQYVRPGAKVTMKALASVDSDTFPVVFNGSQEDDGIQGYVEVVGSRDSVAPDRFCFRLVEITTDDMCGGVGALLYRNRFNLYDFKYAPAAPGVNYFLNNVHCK